MAYSSYTPCSHPTAHALSDQTSFQLKAHSRVPGESMQVTYGGWHLGGCGKEPQFLHLQNKAVSEPVQVKRLEYCSKCSVM